MMLNCNHEVTEAENRHLYDMYIKEGDLPSTMTYEMWKDEQARRMKDWDDAVPTVDSFIKP